MSRGRWLFKEEPSHYAFTDLQRDGSTRWSGVRNPLAQKHLRGVKAGDEVLYYQTGDDKAVVGIAKATGDAYPDPGDPAGKLWAVDVAPVRALPRPVTLAQCKARKELAAFPLVRMPRLSVMPVSPEEWKLIVSLATASSSSSSG